MNVKVDQLETHEARLTIDVTAAELSKAQQAVSANLSKELRFPGFRPGKVPMAMVMKAVGDEAFNREVADELARRIYSEALDESKVNPYGPGLLEELKLDPPQLITRVPLMPVVDLKDYRTIRMAYEEPTVADEEIQAQLESIQNDNALVESVERPAEIGDFLDGRIVAYNPDNEALFDLEEKQFVLEADLDAAMHLPGLADAVVGMTAGQTKSIELTVDDSEEDEALRGAVVRAEITVDRVNKRELPAIDDALAQTVGAYENIGQLRAKLSEQLLEYKRDLARREYGDRVIDAFVSLSTITMPPTYMEDRVNESVADLKERVKREDKMDFSDWLKLNGTTEEKVHEDMHANVERQARINLVLGGVRNQENMNVTSEELAQALDRQIKLAADSGVDLKRVAQTQSYRENIANRLLTDKVVARMVDIAMGKVEAQSAEAAPVEASPTE